MRILWKRMLGALLLPGLAQAAPPQRIADAWYAHNATLILLGATDRIVATVDDPKRVPWMFHIKPQLARASFVPTEAMNAEELLRLRADLVFVTRSGHSAPALRAAGLNVVEEGFSTFDGLLDCVTSTAALLEDPKAMARARDYRQAFEAELRDSAAVAHEPPRVLHVQSLRPLKVDGDGTIIDAWIRHAGGMNAAMGVHGNMQTVTIEQVLAWNPSIVIIGARAGDPAQLSHDPLWQRVAAVRDGHVYRNPEGVFPWDRYSPEMLLQLQWARDIVQKGGVDRSAMIERIRSFYRRFYDSALDVSDAGRILDGLPPVP